MNDILLVGLLFLLFTVIFIILAFVFKFALSTETFGPYLPEIVKYVFIGCSALCGLITLILAFFYIRHRK